MGRSLIRAKRRIRARCTKSPFLTLFPLLRVTSRTPKERAHPGGGSGGGVSRKKRSEWHKRPPTRKMNYSGKIRNLSKTTLESSKIPGKSVFGVSGAPRYFWEGKLPNSNQAERDKFSPNFGLSRVHLFGQD